MDRSFVERLEKRARTMLPAETAMLVECRGDGGDRACQILLEHIFACGLQEKELCPEPYETLVFDDRVLLRCRGCARQTELPQILGIGRGQTEEEARQNALYALTLPVGRWERHWGEGPVQVQVESCVFNRVAYEKL